MPDTFGTVFQRLRRRSRYRLQDVAKAAGTSRQYLSAIEHGRHIPSRSTVDRLITSGIELSPAEIVWLQSAAFQERGEICPHCQWGAPDA